MTITVSVSLVPSRLLRAFVLSFGAACVGMAAACAAGWLGPSLWPAATAACCLAVGLALIRLSAARPTARAIDVLGPGSLVLTVQQEDGASERVQVRLLPASTLWPGLLVLRFDRAPTLVLFADSVPPGQFRRLAVALRTSAARASGVAEKNYQNH